MKKPLIAFLVVFAIAFGIFAMAEMNKIDTTSAIVKSPAVIVAIPDGITKKTKKGRTSFQVNYTYAVAGTKYAIDTEFFDTEAEAMALAKVPVQVIYPTTAPDQGIFKTEFDRRDPNAGMGGAVLSAAGFGLLLSVVMTLVLVWKFPWMRTA